MPALTIKSVLALRNFKNESPEIRGDDRDGYEKFYEVYNPVLEWIKLNCSRKTTKNIILDDCGFLEEWTRGLIIPFYKNSDILAFKLQFGQETSHKDNEWRN